MSAWPKRTSMSGTSIVAIAALVLVCSAGLAHAAMPTNQPCAAADSSALCLPATAAEPSILTSPVVPTLVAPAVPTLVAPPGRDAAPSRDTTLPLAPRSPPPRR